MKASQIIRVVFAALTLIAFAGLSSCNTTHSHASADVSPPGTHYKGDPYHSN